MTERVGAVLTRPMVDVAQAAAILASGWGVEGDLRPLPSERDRNIAVAIGGTDAYVLKIANAADEVDLLEFQLAALARLRAGGVPCPEAVPALDGRLLVPVGDRLDEAAGGSPIPLLARLMRWLPGRPLATVDPHDRCEALLRDLGRTTGRTARALTGWDHPAAHRPFQWNPLAGLAVIDRHAGAVEDSARRRLLVQWRARLEPLGHALPGLRQSVIHNDANDHNVLVSDDATAVTGLLDMGDSVWSVTINELAVAAAYAAFGADDPLTVIDIVRAGFEDELPLAPGEDLVLVDLVALRLATSVALSAHQASLDPSDPYLTVSEPAAWTLLERLAATRPGPDLLAATRSGAE
jgi:Ser/Thr protein kinase RdoA (MazF antagonist)